MIYKEEKLGDYIDILSGFAFKTKDFVEKGVPIIKIKNISPPSVTLDDLTYVSYEIAEKQKKFNLSYDDILIAMTGSHINQWASVVGRVARVKYSDKTLLNQRVGKITIKENVEADLNYIYYFLSQDEIKIKLAAKAGGAANQANISPTHIKELNFPCPNYDTQKKIANILKSYDDLIENNQKQIKLLEEAAQRLYKEWFVDLRFPGHENMSIIDGVPEGWKLKPLSEVFDYVRGKSYTSKELVENGGTMMANLKNIRAFGGYNRNAEKRYAGKYNEEQKLNAGDLVMGVTDMTQERRLVGQVAMVPDLGETMTFSMDLIKLVPLSVTKSFLYSTMFFGGYSKKIAPLANGVNVLHLKPESMMNMEMIIPSEWLMKQYDKRFKVYQRKIELLQKQCDFAREARDRLLPKLMSGEIEV